MRGRGRVEDPGEVLRFADEVAGRMRVPPVPPAMRGDARAVLRYLARAEVISPAVVVRVVQGSLVGAALWAEIHTGLLEAPKEVPRSSGSRRKGIARLGGGKLVLEPDPEEAKPTTAALPPPGTPGLAPPGTRALPLFPDLE